MPDLIKPYYTFADELTVIDGFIFKSNRSVVPKALRNEMLSKIHYHHLNIEKCKSSAREVLYWPNINKHIENLIQIVFLVSNTIEGMLKNS